MSQSGVHRGSENRSRCASRSFMPGSREWPESTFYEQRSRQPTPAQQRRAGLDGRVKACFAASGGTLRPSPTQQRPSCASTALAVSEKAVEASMARQGLQGRVRKRRRCLTRADARAEELPELLKRDFTAERVNQKWAGDSRAGRHRRAVRCSSLPSRACSPGGRAGFAPARSPSHSRTRSCGHLAWPQLCGEAASPACSFTRTEVHSALPSAFQTGVQASRCCAIDRTRRKRVNQRRGRVVLLDP